MVAITNNGFVQHSPTNSTEADILSPHRSCPLTPTASDCLSISSDSDAHDTSMMSELVPVRRDPALLIERLENSSGRRLMGKRKMRRALNDAALAALVEGCEETPSLVMRPYHSAFQQLLESPTNMMMWHHFTNLSEEDQRLYLGSPKQRGAVIREPLSEKSSSRPPVPTTNPGPIIVVALNGSILYSDPRPPTYKKDAQPRGPKKNESTSLLDPLMSVGNRQNHFELPKLITVSAIKCPTRSTDFEAYITDHNSSTGTRTFDSEGAPQSTASGDQPSGHCQLPIGSVLRHSSSSSKGAAPSFHIAIDPLPAECDISQMDLSQSSSSSFEVLEGSDTDHETEDFFLVRH